MKAILLLNSDGGNGHILKHVDKIKKSLLEVYDIVDAFICYSKEEMIKRSTESCGVYDSLIFAGGDGTFHLIVNTLSKLSNTPTIGIIPSGTLCDAAKNFGASKNFKKALKIIKKGQSMDCDVVSINDEYFIFEASYGVYADIPIRAKHRFKKIFGHFLYYFMAVPEMLKMKTTKMRLTLDNNEEVEIATPFLLVMNSSYMGGFKINKKSVITDGLIDVFSTKKELFNGLFSYFFFKKRVTHYQVKSLKIHVDGNNNWDIDGEAGPKGDVTMKVIPNRLKIFYKNNNN